MTDYGLLIDYEWCTGCHSCEVACNQMNNFGEGRYGIKVFELKQKLSDKEMMIDYIPVPTEICNLCLERVDKAQKPACVHSCPADVIKFGPIEYLSKLMVKKKAVLWGPRLHR